MPAPTLLPVTELTFTTWDVPKQKLQIQQSLEQGSVIALPHLPFILEEQEMTLLTPALVSPRRKNISYSPDKQRISGVHDPQKENAVKQLTERYYQCTTKLLNGLLPGYRNALCQPTTSLRLHPVAAWRSNVSWRKDDSRLHIDSFPSRPVYGERILRIFTNINPAGEPRIWRIGETFDSLVARFLPTLRPWSPMFCWLLATFGITKRKRSHYDHLMLALHDEMKSASYYQLSGVQQVIEFAAGSTWICFSDQTPHAAMSGQFMLEQTFLLPVNAMHDPDLSPLHVLEKLMKRPLI